MKIKLNKNLKKVVCSLVLVGTIASCVIVAPSVRNSTNSDAIKGNYYDEDVKNNKEAIMMIISKDKKKKSKGKVKSKS